MMIQNTKKRWKRTWTLYFVNWHATGIYFYSALFTYFLAQFIRFNTHTVDFSGKIHKGGGFFLILIPMVTTLISFIKNETQNLIKFDEMKGENFLFFPRNFFKKFIWKLLLQFSIEIFDEKTKKLFSKLRIFIKKLEILLLKIEI